MKNDHAALFRKMRLKAIYIYIYTLHILKKLNFFAFI